MFHLQGESQRRSCEVSESHKQPIDGGQTGDSFWLLELFLLIQEEIEEKIDAGEGVFSASIMQVSGEEKFPPILNIQTGNCSSERTVGQGWK